MYAINQYGISHELKADKTSAQATASVFPFFLDASFPVRASLAPTTNDTIILSSANKPEPEQASAYNQEELD